MPNPKEILRFLLKSIGYDIRKYIPAGGKPINFLELAVRSRLFEHSDFFFLQVGANDGVMDDPLYALIRKYCLKGLLIEPMPDFVEPLRQNYIDQPQLQFEQCAVSMEDGERDLFRIRAGTYANVHAAGLASFDRGVLLQHKKFYPNIERHIEVLRVRTRTISSLLRDHKISKIDLLQVDTEGFDAEIVKMVLASDTVPAVINFEHRHLTIKELDDTRDLLCSKGYRIHIMRYDTLAILHALPEE